MKISCIITDDEPLARKGLRSYVDKVDFLELVAECGDAVSLNNQLAAATVDLVFLDIEMPYISGIELLTSLANPPKIIFTTAYEKYALKGYELDVLDYLLKPISFDRFLRSANKAYEYFVERNQPLEAGTFFIKTEGRYLKLDWKDIVLIEAMENYMCIHTGGGKHLVHITMKQLQEKMPSNFLQVHKSSIINMDRVTGIQGNIIELGGLQAAISRGLKDSVMEKILQNRL